MPADPTGFFAARLAQIEPFHVMDILARAKALQADGRDIVHLEVGEPDFSSPKGVVQAGVDALLQGETHYTPALGLPALRRAIAQYYRETLNCPVTEDQVVVTTGSSGALLLLFAMLVEEGTEVLLPDPGYPCYRHYARLFGGVPRCIPVGWKENYQLNAKLIAEHWTPRTKFVLLSTPSNPTGTMLDPAEMKNIVDTVAQKGGLLLVDEIYQGLVYDAPHFTARGLSGDLIVINSFSKYFGMTGWRLGWCVMPTAYVPAMDKLAQNFFLSPPTCSQFAALAAFQPDTHLELEERRRQLRQRRDFLLPRLETLGFKIAVKPQGAFYIYADCSALTQDSQVFCARLLDKAGVAITPGIDFGTHRAKQHVRIAYTQPVERLQEAVRRIGEFLAAEPRLVS